MNREPLWAPWRVEYINKSKDRTEGCLFCRVIKEGEKAAKRNLVLAFRPGVVIMMNRYPYTNGHLMVAPQKHAGALASYTDKEIGQLFQAVRECEEALLHSFKWEGINIGLNVGKAAGAGIADHLHVHLVPRWVGDTNFMTIIGEVRVIPQHLRATYKILKKRFTP